MSNDKIVDFTQGRYGTDSGPQCSKKCLASGETLWIYLVQYPYHNAVGQCCCCHDVVNVPLLSNGAPTFNGDEITISMIKAAHELWATTKPL